ncbi:MAG: hypothetical protein AB4368_02415 [Xenococcaceae cyanobacterium]
MKKLLFSRKSFFFTIIFSICLFSILFLGGIDKLGSTVPPKPEKPKIIAIAPPKNLELEVGIPVIEFSDNRVPRQWLYGNSSDRFKLFRPLPDDLIVEESLPEFTDAINLNTFAQTQEGGNSLFVTVVSFKQPQLLRVCYGLTGSNITAKMRIAKKLVYHGELIRVQPGLYPWAIEVNHAKPQQLARLAPRLTKVTEQEVDEVYQWRLARWQKTIEMSQKNDDRLLASVQFDPSTIRGKEGFFRVGQSVNGRWWFIDPEGLFYQNKPNLKVVNPLRWANSRAVSIATEWDRQPVKTTTPLQGQIFMTLQGGKVTVEELTPVRESDRPSFKLKGEELIIGLVCRQGVWDTKVYGNEIRGTVVNTQNDGESIEFKLELKDDPNLKAKAPANAEYTLNLIRNDTKLEGTFKGTYNNYPVEGRAVGYLYRPVATVRY